MTECPIGAKERLTNARRELKRYLTMQRAGRFIGPETPAVVAHEIRNWQTQVHLLELLVAPTPQLEFLI